MWGSSGDHTRPSRASSCLPHFHSLPGPAASTVTASHLASCSICRLGPPPHHPQHRQPPSLLRSHGPRPSTQPSAPHTGQPRSQPCFPGSPASPRSRLHGLLTAPHVCLGALCGPAACRLVLSLWRERRAQDRGGRKEGQVLMRRHWGRSGVCGSSRCRLSKKRRRGKSRSCTVTVTAGLTRSKVDWGAPPHPTGSGLVWVPVSAPLVGGSDQALVPSALTLCCERGQQQRGPDGLLGARSEIRHTEGCAGPGTRERTPHRCLHGCC